ncbi:TIGR04222 domain-containing membrane protein [Nocardiopsis eucommiae]|uniref:TIGR04222 domain-containing membrane protein n=1 Tax=Nocardiopsis eucommiae TaxID=2831970 RepID=UPI003D73E6A9
MDATVLIPILGALLGLAIGVFPLVKVFQAYRSIGAAIASVPVPTRRPRPEELTPNELAHLVGGATRVGEVVLMDLFLSGRVRRQTRGGFFTLVGPSNAYVTEKDQVRRDIVKAFKDRTGLTARGMIRTATFSRGIDRVRERLAERRLIAHSGELTKALADFHDGGWIAQKLSLVSAGLLIGGVVLVTAYEQNGWTVAMIVLGGVLSVLNGLTSGLYLARGGRNVTTRTPAGTEVLVEAERTYSVGRVEERSMVREVALRHVAVIGLGRMGREGGQRGRGVDGSGGDAVRVVTDSGSARLVEESAGRVGERTPEPREGFELDWGSLCEFAGLCSVGGHSVSSDGSGSHGGSPSGGLFDGGSGDASGGGDSGGGDGGGGGGGD